MILSFKFIEHVEKILWQNNVKDSFSEYINAVYGEVPNVTLKNKLDTVYRRLDVSFRFQNPYLKRNLLIDPHMQNHFITFQNIDYYNPSIIKNYEWVEVTRGSTGCHIYGYMPDLDHLSKEKLEQIEEFYYEGFSKGFPLDKDFEKREPQPYGCWFYILRGTGIYVNVGKTLVANSRSDAFYILNLTCINPPYCYGGENDFNICSKVIEKGYDSIQIYNSHDRKVHELAYCGGECALQRVSSSCPPLELRTGWNATKECICNSSYPIVNCNNEITDITDCHDIKSQKYKVKETCYFEDFDWINEFQTKWDGSIGILFFWGRHNIAETLPKIKKFVEEQQRGGWQTVLVDSGDFSVQKKYDHSISYILTAMNDAGFDIVPILRNSEYDIMLKSKHKLKFHLLSLTLPEFLRSVIVTRAGVKIGFISFTAHEFLLDDLELLAQLIIDEALCLKRSADIIILISGAALFIDEFIAHKVNTYVDIILGGNSQTMSSCNGKWHSSNDNVIIHSGHESSFLTMISIDVFDKNNYLFQSKILDVVQSL